MIALPLSYNTGEYPEGIFSSLTDASKEASCWRFERGGFYTWQELEEKGISTERDHVSLHLGWVQTENQDVEIIVVWPNVYACCDSEWEEYEIRVRFNLGGLEDFEEWREYDLRVIYLKTVGTKADGEEWENWKKAYRFNRSYELGWGQFGDIN